MSVMHPGPDATATMELDVEVRGRTERITWRAGRIEADAWVRSRLGQRPFDTADPVAFLHAVRRAFGGEIVVHVSS
jgi:hypothetical protein